MPPTLPIEVCERVLDLVPPDRRWQRLNVQTFYICCLVCRDWVPRSRLHLYTSVRLCPSNLTEFIRGISLQPFNGHLVRKLELSETFSNWRSDHHKLSLVPLQLPQLLPSLRHIELYDIRLADLHPKFFTYLSRFRSVHSTRVSVGHCPTIMQLARYLTAFSHLDECKIDLKERDIESISFPGVRLPTKRIAVSKLTLNLPHHPFKLVDLILDIFSPSSIRSLSIELGSRLSEQYEVAEMVASFMTRCAGPLSELTLKHYEWGLDLSQNTGLVSLCLSMYGFPDDWDPTANLSQVSTITRILSTICSTHLKELYLGILVVTDSKDTISPFGWDAPDATLALPTFREVEYISIKVKVTPRAKDDASEFPFSRVSERTVRQLLPRLAARSVADFSLPVPENP